MRARAVLILICLGAGIVTYRRLPELLQEWTRDVHGWHVSMVLTSAALGVGLVTGVACAAVLIVYGRAER